MTVDSTLVTQPPLPEPDEEVPASANRFGRRWRLVGAGLSNVWRYGDLVMDAASGRLLMRGPNGTGKTTALEVLWPYLLDLNERMLGAGKARQTTLSSLMREGAGARRRVGHVWLTFAGPGDGGELSYGVRLQFSEGASPPVKVVPFRVPGRPLRDLALLGEGRATLTIDEFRDAVADAGGQVFTDEDEYVADLAARLLRTSAAEARHFAGRIRQVRNPNLLGDLTPQAARAALRDALPGVSDEVITATAEALAESSETRKAFDRDRDNAAVVADFAQVWAGHVAEVLRGASNAAREATAELRRRRGEKGRVTGELTRTRAEYEEAARAVSDLREYSEQLEGMVRALEKTDAFKAAGALTALEGQLRAEQETAQSTWEGLASSAEQVRIATDGTAASLDELSGDVAAQQRAVAAADSDATHLDALVTYRRTPRAVFTSGDDSADPGAALTITSDVAAIADAATAWRQLADRHTARANAARLALDDYKPVAAADETAVKAEQQATATSTRFDAEERALRVLTEQTLERLRALVDTLVEFVEANRDLAGTDANISDNDDSQGENDSWDSADLLELHFAEPGQGLTAADDFARHVETRAASVAAQLRAQADGHDRRAGELRQEAAELRDEASKLRDGKMLPLPRPAWAGSGDDDLALGAVIDWNADVDDSQRQHLEVALVAAGLLGATLSSDGAATIAWQVSAYGTPVQPNLTAVLAVDNAHPLAVAAQAVLERIAVRDTAGADDVESGALVVGRDGTFRAGVASGDTAAANDAALVFGTGHVGARQRRTAALARAEQLETHAAELDAVATELREEAKAWRRDAADVRCRANEVPSRQPLRVAETRRAGKATEVSELTAELHRLEAAAQRLRRQHRQLRDEWTDRTVARDLPADPEQLAGIETTAGTTAATIRRAAGELADRFAPRLARLTEAARDDASVRLGELYGKARVAAEKLVSTQSEFDTLRANAGADAEQVMQQHRDAAAELQGTLEQMEPATEKAAGLRGEVARLGEQARAADERVEEAKKPVEERMREFARLLDVPGVVDAVLGGVRPGGTDLLADLEASLGSVRSYTKKTLRERYDEARARLAGTWALSPGDSIGELDTYVFSFDDGSFSPIRAADHARSVATKAEEALAAADEKALREFVVGMLPSAIRTAWVRMHEWTKEVNRKMRSAAASSQLSVQVRVSLADDLSEHSRTVYELACRTFEGDRTPDQNAAVGKALQALIAAADGETMAEKVAAAVNIREWVDVMYEIRRPDGTTANWTSRTGLSGGERRLVVLAPMLAAIAANYDRFGDSALRLAALDEVPAEVDERGREGLARYLAKLDLDLVCTSYLWDGAPGAWDGIDAWDLEAADDTTVIAFPMLVRGLVPIPGEAVPEVDAAAALS